MRYDDRTEDFMIRGDIIYSKGPDELVACPDSFLVVKNCEVEGVYDRLPEKYAAAGENMRLLDCSGHLVVPGLCDIHLHAPQYSFRGLGYDMQLLDWLNTYTFPEESSYGNPEYADKAYSIFAQDLQKSPTTRACIFATIHPQATMLLMEKLEKTGVKGYAGKVNMDRNSPDYYCEKSAEDSLSATVAWIQDAREHFRNFQPIITPRFTISCTDTLMEMLGLAAHEFHLPTQSHLSENRAEIQTVHELCPCASHYVDTYVQPHIIAPDVKSVMAHGVWSDDYELKVLKENGTFLAHCPQSNMNIASGIAPVRKWLDMGLNIGLGTDVAGGASLSIFRTMFEAMQVSRLLYTLKEPDLKPLSFEEAFYLGTKGGGAFFGKVGSFEPGFRADILVLDDSRLHHPQPLSVSQRLERFIALSSGDEIQHKFVDGKMLF